MSQSLRNRRIAGEEEYSSDASSTDNDDEPNGNHSPSHQQERDLSPEEMDKLVQFQDITGLDDLQICRALLESKSWDLEATAREYLNLPQSSQDRQGSGLSNPRFIPTHHDAPEVRTAPSSHNGPIRPAGGGVVANQGGFISWTLYMLTLPVRWPLNIAFRAMSGLLQFVANLFGFAPSRGGGGGGRGRSVQFWPTAAPADPVGDVQRFRESFESRFGSTHPTFFIGSYSQVLEKAKQDLQFVLAYLHSPSHDDTDQFCQSTLSSEHLTNFLNDHNVLFWGCSVETSEGHRVSQALREATYPFMALVVLRQNRMMIVGRFEGLLSPEEVTQRLEMMIRDNEAYIVAARAERQERQLNQQIRLEQDQALQESLRQDQEKERKKREAEEKKRQEEEEERRQIEAEAQKKDLVRRLKIDFASRVIDEPDQGHPGVVRVLIKLPDGQRLDRRFKKEDSLKSLFYYVFCHPSSPDEFDITTNFPRKVIPCRPENIADMDIFETVTFEEAGLVQSVMLFVNDLDA